jgi:hypothetical protein
MALVRIQSPFRSWYQILNREKKRPTTADSLQADA